MLSLRDRPSTPFIMNLTARLKRLPYTPLQIAIHAADHPDWLALSQAL